MSSFVAVCSVIASGSSGTSAPVNANNPNFGEEGFLFLFLFCPKQKTKHKSNQKKKRHDFDDKQPEFLRT